MLTLSTARNIHGRSIFGNSRHVTLLMALALLKQQSGMAIEMVFTGSDKGNAG